MPENLEIIEGLVVGRVRPHIYAFSTNSVPGHVKVGDTYRPVAKRLQEWRRHYPELQPLFERPATISEDVYFRDHAVHSYLEALGRARLPEEGFGEGVFYSREFFGDASPEDIDAAIEDIHRDHGEPSGRYKYYDTERRLPATIHFERGGDWALRPNQRDAVDAFAAAWESGRTNLLMYAVMRFGKTFTSLMCAKRIDAEVVLVVSAKADVKAEWKQTTEAAGNFEGYVFLEAEDLLGDADAIAESLAENKGVVVFLTLQDLHGEPLKEKHREIFGTEIDLLIIDETHFGARGEKYGEVLRAARQPADSGEAIEREDDDRVGLAEAEDQLKVFDAKVRLHLSGSPYRILMGSEFAAEEIIAFVQFTDIAEEQEDWDLKHPDENEWDNPYFGFPQMIRFALNPNRSSRERLEALRKDGVSFAFSALLKPRSLTLDRDEGRHKQFEHEAEILDLLRVIDGTREDENLLGFLDLEQIKRGGMCRHMVMVLPYRASCDAMQALIEGHSGEFENLGGYEVVNISGLGGIRRYATPAHVKAAIARADREGRKTLTLTVNRMLTGSTVEQWDTMLYLKDTASPQEYDQATFRLQSQHVRELRDETGTEVVRENLKPQTLLVDFDPARLFRMQEQRSLTSNANAEESGNAHLGERLEKELAISPVITMNSDKLSEVSATDILEAVSEYNRGRSVADEARDVPVDLRLLDVDAIRRVIERQAELGSKQGLSVEAVEGDEVDLELDEDRSEPDPSDGSPDTSGGGDPDETKALERKLQTYYQRILFFAMLTPDPVASLRNVIDVIGEGDNARIAESLGLDAGLLEEIHRAFDPFKLNRLDYKIQNIDRLVRDEDLLPLDRASRALDKIARLSDSEVRTPPWLCEEIVGRIPDDELRALVERGEKVLDVASKSGEFAIAFYRRLVEDLGIDPEVARSVIYSVPTSRVAYEFTRRFYEILGLDVEHIATTFTAYDLPSLQPSNDPEARAGLRGAFGEGNEAVKFGAIVGNPPYQTSDGGAQASARSIYPRFFEISAALEPEFMSLIIPSRWYAGGKHVGDFREWMLSDPHISELHDFPRPEQVFPETNNRGGVCYFLRDTNYDAGEAGGTKIFTRDARDVEFEVTRSLNTFEMGVFLRDSRGIDIVEKVLEAPGFASLEDRISPRRPFDLDGNMVGTPDFHETADRVADPVRCFAKGRTVGFVSRGIVRVNADWIDRWKVMTSRSNNIGTELNDDNQNAFAAEPGTVCTETFIVVGTGLDLTEETAENLVAYLKSKFARFLHAKAKVSQDATRRTYRFVPQVDVTADSGIDWGAPTESIDEQLFDLYGLTEPEREHIRDSIKPMAGR